MCSASKCNSSYNSVFFVFCFIYWNYVRLIPPVLYWKSSSANWEAVSTFTGKAFLNITFGCFRQIFSNLHSQPHSAMKIGFGQWALPELLYFQCNDFSWKLSIHHPPSHCFSAQHQLQIWGPNLLTLFHGKTPPLWLSCRAWEFKPPLRDCCEN